jgi:16S rRNA (guanine(966)-N(2))-methyltransferase RsmD
MRVVSGEAKGRRLKTPGGDRIRPTADRVKESMFEIIAGRIPDARVLDLFAGTGNLGIEALSRGARSGLFVDADRSAVKLIRENLARTRLDRRAEIWKSDARAALDRLRRLERRFDIVLLDPPYGSGYQEIILKMLDCNGILLSRGVIAVEHDRRSGLPQAVGSLERFDLRCFGDTVLSFYEESRRKVSP